MAMDIYYLYHSGFCVVIDKTLLIFDYYKTEPADAGINAGVIDREFLRRFDSAVFFVTHAHGDHFNSDIYAFRDVPGVSYVLSYDIDESYSGNRLSPGKRLSLNDAAIEAFGSTDQGVSYLVSYGGYNVFHAGDLNFWHWSQESTPREIDAAETAYKTIVDQIVTRTRQQRIDVAMFPVDPRQGREYESGARWFALVLKPHVLIPMHFADEAGAAKNFAREKFTHTKIVPLTVRGQKFTYEKE